DVVGPHEGVAAVGGLHGEGTIAVLLGELPKRGLCLCHRPHLLHSYRDGQPPKLHDAKRFAWVAATPTLAKCANLDSGGPRSVPTGLVNRRTVKAQEAISRITPRPLCRPAPKHFGRDTMVCSPEE